MALSTESLLFSPLLLVVFLAGCGDRGPPPMPVERRDSAGTEIVEYASLVPTRSLEVASEPEVWIQGAGRIPSFGWISGIAFLSDGTIIAADGSANEIYAFSREGSYLWSAGGAGAGPGEFGGIGHLFVTPQDSILAVDRQLARVTLLSPTGALERDERFPSGVGAPVGLLSNGQLLYLREEREDEPVFGVRRTWAMWVAVGLAQPSVDTLLTTRGRELYLGQAAGRNVLAAPEYFRRVVVAPVEAGFFLALTDRPQIDLYGLNGDLLKSVRVPERELSAGAVDEQAVRDGFLVNVPEAMVPAIREMAADIPIPLRWPPIGALISDDVGRLWVGEYHPPNASEVTWHVLATDGTYMGAVAFPGGFTPQAIHDGLIAGIWKDDLDVQSIRLYRIRGG